MIIFLEAVVEGRKLWKWFGKGEMKRNVRAFYPVEKRGGFARKIAGKKLPTEFHVKQL
jgi:hypothetical protein